jgi:hypothetical protein
MHRASFRQRSDSGVSGGVGGERFSRPRVGTLQLMPGKEANAGALLDARARSAEATR